jgi:Leucine-rich repeat (LRR) protein
MNKILFLILLLAGSIVAQGITLSKDSLKICNNPVSSFADYILLINGTSAAVHLDSAFLLINQMDTTGSGRYGGLPNRFQIRWAQAKPLRYNQWSLEKLAGETYRLSPAASSSIHPSVDFSAPGETLSISQVELGTCLGCSGLPEWYPLYFTGKLQFYFSNGQIINIRLYSSDLRKLQSCTDYACDSISVRKILDRNGMSAVPVTQVTTSAGGRITTLTLSYNLASDITLPKPCTVLPSEIGNLTALKTIYAFGNTFDTISSAIGKCVSLQTLIANNNGISELPESIGNCPLQLIHLEKNKLTRLPESIGSLKKLMELSVTNNKLTSLPSSLVLLDSLRCIFIGNNRICSLSDPLISWLKDVKRKMYCERFDPPWPESQDCSTPIQQHLYDEKADQSSLPGIHYSNGVLTIENRHTTVSKLTIQVFDGCGRLVKSADVTGPYSTSTPIRMPFPGLSAGFYYTTLLSGDEIIGTCRVAIDR